jgi:hypothetical protein
VKVEPPLRELRERRGAAGRAAAPAPANRAGPGVERAGERAGSQTCDDLRDAACPISTG